MSSMELWLVLDLGCSLFLEKFDFRVYGIENVKMDDPNITMEEYIRLEEEKARRHGKVYNWETATYGKIWYDEDVHDHRSVETEFPAIVFNEALTSEVTLSCEHTKYETSLSECDGEEQNVLYFNDLFPFNLIHPDDLKSDKDNNDDKIDIEQSSGNLSIEPLPNVIKINKKGLNTANYGENNVGDTQDSQEHKKEHEGNEHTLSFKPTHDPSVCHVRRFEMIKYSFDADDEYVAIKEHECFDHSRTNIDAC
ncbi:hypothetical protein Tco_0064747 [Tanacetum coccineum]